MGHQWNLPPGAWTLQCCAHCGAVIATNHHGDRLDWYTKQPHDCAELLYVRVHQVSIAALAGDELAKRMLPPAIEMWAGAL